MFKVKYKPDRTIEKYIAWLVIQGFSQVLEVDFTKTFGSTI